MSKSCIFCSANHMILGITDSDKYHHGNDFTAYKTGNHKKKQ